MYYFVKENSSDYLHELNYDDFLLVKEECCADERNFLNLLLFQRKKTAYLKQVFQKEPFSCSGTLSTCLTNLRHLFYISYTLFSFQFASYVNSKRCRNFYLLQEILFYC